MNSASKNNETSEQIVTKNNTTQRDAFITLPDCLMSGRLTHIYAVHAYSSHLDYDKKKNNKKLREPV